MQIEKAPANQENIFINLSAAAANAHNTNKVTHCKWWQHNKNTFICRAFLNLCVLWEFAAAAVKLMKMFSWFAGAFSICSVFLYLVVLWAYVVCVCCKIDEVVFRAATNYYFDNRLVGRLFFRLIALNKIVFIDNSLFHILLKVLQTNNAIKKHTVLNLLDHLA